MNEDEIEELLSSINLDGWGDIELIPELWSDFKFEYAHESLTTPESQFKKILPIK